METNESSHRIQVHGRTEAVKGGQGKTQGAWTSGVKQVASCVMASYHAR